MSLIPYVQDIINNSYPGGPLYDQNFGLGLWDDDLWLNRPSFRPLLSSYYRPFRPYMVEDSGVSTVTNQKDQFKVNLDVQQFKPEDINVKVSGDYLIVEGKHEEKQDKHGYISRQFTRRYLLPEDVQKEAIASNISSDGVLQINAPKRQQAIENGKERSIPITQTNQPAIKKNAERDGEKES